MSDPSVKPLHVLVLGDLAACRELCDWVDGHTEVHQVDSFERAACAMRHEPFDVIICDADHFIPFREAQFAEQAGLILDTVKLGLCLVKEDGQIVWANPSWQDFPDDIRASVNRCCTDTLHRFQEATPPESSLAGRGRRFSLNSEDGRRFDISTTPVLNAENRLSQVAAVVWETTCTRRLQEKIDAIDEAGRELVRLDAEQFSKLDTQERLALIEQKILRCTREVLNFDNFAIFVLDKRVNRLDLVFASGMPAETKGMELHVSAEGNGICGHVASKGRSYICPDVTRDPRYIPGIKGAKSSLTVPLRLQDRIIGVANFESTHAAAFSEDDRQFAEIFGRYVALALHILELLVTERHTTTGRLGSDVMAEITEPLNDILTDVENLVEDYIGHDDLRHRLRKISENSVRIRDSIKEVTSPERGIIGSRQARHTRHDPILTGKRILIADDQDIIRDTVRDILSGYGCVVTAVPDGAAAIAEIAKQPFDLVLTDIKMPARSGYEVFAAAKDANPKTPVLMMTGFGYDPNHSIVRARREGLTAVLFKPFKVDQLLSEIRTGLKELQQK